MEDQKKRLIGLSRSQLKEELQAIGVPENQAKMRVHQIWHWLYVRGVHDFDEMLNLGKELRSKLQQFYSITHPEIVEEQVSKDGTRKWLLRFPPRGAGAPVEIETVYIPETDRGTLCVSSQVGCSLSCTFCHTGTQRMVRNLHADEILGQIMLARHRLSDFVGMEPVTGMIAPLEGRKISNIVMMGMGEPLYNFDAVRDALLIVQDGDGIGISKRRITLSTSGVVPEIARTADEIGCLLAISFHATTDETRDFLVPINKRWNIQELLQALANYPKVSNSERITFEYVMLDGVNDSDEDAHRLIDHIKSHNIPAKINLIPFNEWPGAPYKRSSNNRIRAFANIIYQAGYASPIRKTRGEDIMAACGQLKSATERARKSRKQIEAEAGLQS